MTIIKRRLGDLLQECNLISKEQCEQALIYQKERGAGLKLGQALIELSIVTEDDIIWALGNQLNVSFIHLSAEIVDKSVLNLISADFALDHKLIPLYINKNQLSVCMVDPLDVDAIDYLAAKTGKEVSVSICTSLDFEMTFKTVYGPLEVQDKLANEITAPEKQFVGGVAGADRAIPRGMENPEKVVNYILGQAINNKVDRIHFEPSEKGVVIRFRSCSGLSRKLEIPLKVHVEIIAKLKVLSQISAHQEGSPGVVIGHFRVSVSGRMINIQSLFYPTVNGEMVLLKLNDFGGNPDETLHGSKEFLSDIARFVKTNHGILYVTGPHESGRTTTQYFILNSYDVESVKIVTVEDPVQISHPRMTQIQLGQNGINTVVDGLELALKLDADLIYLDHLSEGRVAEIVAFAGLGGKTVLTSFMAHDAASSVVRLLELVRDPVVVAISLCGFLSQRLVRTLCSHCRVAVEPDPEVMERLRAISETPIFNGAVGCESCHGTGYVGRTLISEFIPTSPTLRQMMINRQSYQEFSQFARKEGIPTLEDQALMLVAVGETTYDEFLRLF
ncbi:MAG: Flp pilus assembly complex ATPase component TadA [Candidatus Riflebacteria bacterium]|nr:Flp pilus assembly complex ATPase component TadA [Candidatus Riflebacteria bacterium]